MRSIGDKNQNDSYTSRHSLMFAPRSDSYTQHDNKFYSYPNIDNIDLDSCCGANFFTCKAPLSAISNKICSGAGIRQCWIPPYHHSDSWYAHV